MATQNQIAREQADLDRRSKEKQTTWTNKSKEGIARADRQSRESIAAKDRKQKYVDTAVNAVGKHFDRGAGLLGLASKVLAKNDPSWYGDPETIAKSAGVNVDLPIGGHTPVVKGVPYMYGAQPNISAATKYFTAPSLFKQTLATDADSIYCAGTYGGHTTYETAPTLGGRTGNTAQGINAAATSIWMKIRELVTNSVSYDPSNVMGTIVTSNELVKFLCFVRRSLSLAKQVNAQNLIEPAAILGADGWDVDDLVVNSYSKLERWFETFIPKVEEVLTVPEEYNIIKRSIYMYSRVFLTSDVKSRKCSTYSFTPAYWLTFNSDQSKLVPAYEPNSAWSGSSLGYFCPDGWKFTVDKVILLGEYLFDQFFLTTDNLTILGHIKKAYPKLEKLGFTVTMSDPYVYDEIMNYEVANATYLGYPLIYEDDGGNIDDTRVISLMGSVLVNTPMFLGMNSGSVTDNSYKFGACIQEDFRVPIWYKKAPEPGEIVDITRFSACGKSSPNQDSPVAAEGSVKPLVNYRAAGIGFMQNLPANPTAQQCGWITTISSCGWDGILRSVTTSTKLDVTNGNIAPGGGNYNNRFNYMVCISNVMNYQNEWNLIFANMFNNGVRPWIMPMSPLSAHTAASVLLTPNFGLQGELAYTDPEDLVIMNNNMWYGLLGIRK